MNPVATKLRRIRSTVAFLVFDFGLLLLLLNVLAAAALRVVHRGSQVSNAAGRYGIERLEKAHPEWSRKELLDFLAEKARGESSEYAPFTEFQQAPATGRYINVTPFGLRHVWDQGPWPPDPAFFNLFVFGGSTSFGDGLADEQTIPSVLQEALAPSGGARSVRVYNFASPGYFSSQERILFEQLLVSAYRVDAAVFIDGLNEFFYSDRGAAPLLWQAGQTQTLRRLVRDTTRPSSLARLLAFLENLPAVRLARELGGRAEREARERDREAERTWTVSEVEAAAARWERNVAAIEALSLGFRAPVLVVWQPVPVYRYDLSRHLFHDERFPSFPGVRAGYPLMETRRAAGRLGPHVLWLADLQEGRNENLYVDAVHYDAAFSRQIAGEIARALRERGMTP